jgi:hypothetical protein
VMMMMMMMMMMMIRMMMMWSVFVGPGRRLYLCTSRLGRIPLPRSKMQ